MGLKIKRPSHFDPGVNALGKLQTDRQRFPHGSATLSQYFAFFSSLLGLGTYCRLKIRQRAVVFGQRLSKLALRVHEAALLR
jgi:hypothetical protein